MMCGYFTSKFINKGIRIITGTLEKIIGLLQWRECGVSEGSKHFFFILVREL